MALKKFKPKNLDEYVELKPGIWARKDRTAVPISKVPTVTQKASER